MWKLKIAEGGPWLDTCNNHIGREVWEFDERLGSNDERNSVERARQEFHRNRFYNKQSSDFLARMQLAKENKFNFNCRQIIPKNNENITINRVSESLQRAIGYFSAIQAIDGHWPADLPGPLFLTPLLVIVLHVTESLGVLSLEHRKEICRYLYNHQNENGGWGLNMEGPSCMLCTALCYTSLRLLGEGADGGQVGDMYKSRKWIHDHGGATMIPLWGKVVLSVLGAYDWSGVNPIQPEIFLLPSSFPIHPGRLWSRIRLILVPMSYLYGKRFVGPITETVLQLREELHIQPYHNIDWNHARKLCAKEDCYVPETRMRYYICEYLYRINEPVITSWPFSYIRKNALKKIEQYLHYEDENSRYIYVGTVEKSLCMLSCWVRDPNSENFKYHLARVPDYLWVGEDGMKYKAVTSQSWDSALAVQAILACNLAKEFGSTLHKAHNFIKESQILRNPRDGCYRHFSKGGWGFSTVDQGWPVSDCTAEALKAVLLLSNFSPSIVGEHLSMERTYEAVNYLLSVQNPNGGFSTWESTRTYPWVEVFNISEIFADLMVDYQFVECTSSAIQALVLFKNKYPLHRRVEIEKCIKNATGFIENTQNNDGSWFGSWGVCYTYGTWFGVEGLLSVGNTYENCNAIRKACNFLLSKQLNCGGWGESYLSSTTMKYTDLEGKRANVVNTAWAMLALLKAGQIERDPAPLHCAAKYLIDMQLDNGDFPQQEATGSFVKSGLLNYMVYRNVFPIWALGEYQKQAFKF